MTHGSKSWMPSATILVIVLIIAVITVGQIRQALVAQQRSVCKSHLKQIGLALHNYHERYKVFPPAYTLGSNGQKLHSWRTLLLPFIGQDEIYSQIRLNEAWNSPHNRALSEHPLEIYCCTASNRSLRGRTNYFAIVDRATAWPEQYSATIEEIRDGSSNTILLVEAPTRGIHWMEPRDLSRTEALECLKGKNRPSHGSADLGGAHVMLADGTVRFLRTTVDSRILRSMTSINGGAAYPGIEWPQLPIADFEFPEVLRAENLKQTEIWPVVDREIIPGKNLVYCCTFQLAWDRARKIARGEPIELELDPTLADQLNKHAFPKQQLTERDCIAQGGLTAKVLPLIKQELNQKFPEFKSVILDNAAENRLVFYAMLKKSLPFANSFVRLAQPLTFNQTQVESFGVVDIDANDVLHQQLLKQVKVLDYVSNEDFIVKLIPDCQEEIVLAKMGRPVTLEEAINRVQQRVSQPDANHSRYELGGGETLIAPILSINVEREYKELTNREFTNPQFRGLITVDARQIIRFHLDENGAKLESEASLVAADFGPERVPLPRRLIFDKPFLIWLRESGAEQPYFAAWIENIELMARFVNTIHPR